MAEGKEGFNGDGPLALLRCRSKRYVPLSEEPRIGRRGFVYTATGDTAVSGWSKPKTTRDTAVLMAMQKEDPKAEPLEQEH
jgi:hypothetical protein